MSEQYPLNAAEAFLGTAGCWFDVEALDRYAEKRARARSTASSFIPTRSGAKAHDRAGAGRLDHGLRPADKERDYALYVGRRDRARDSTTPPPT